ncbi:polymorphic toxin type 15 domain-containing protein [Stenotrophomonas sp.]|uniref:polymorphic toxin type 15 domain-containing protein n=1 Tax=unclassified Stenotrophomonas TaxID=196198 RepID=UPI0012910BA1|nr:polymorphic toxin type 15 domain-containing protein [Stenotrophomonas sp.]
MFRKLLSGTSGILQVRDFLGGDRQLKRQEQALNDMSVDEYLEARKAFDPKNRDRTVAEAAGRQYKLFFWNRRRTSEKILGSIERRAGEWEPSTQMKQ